MTSTFSIFTLAVKFDCLFLVIFQSFHVAVSFIFDKLAPSPPEYMFRKMFYIPILIHSSALNSLKRAKSVVFVLFCILVDMPMGGGL